MTDIERIVYLIESSGCYWADYRFADKLFEKNGSIYFISTAYINSLAIWEFGVTRLIYLAMLYYDINKPFEILHPTNISRTRDTSIFKYDVNTYLYRGNTYLYRQGYSYLTDTEPIDYGDDFHHRVCEVQMPELLEVIIDEWNFNKVELLVKVLDKYHDYINPKSIVNLIDDIPDMQTDIKTVLLRFLHENDTEERNIGL